MASTLRKVVDPGAAGQRLDRFLADVLKPEGLSVSRAKIQQAILEGRVRVNGQTVKPSTRLRGGDLISLDLPPRRAPSAGPEPIPLNIVYEDEHLVVINKPPGLVVHPGPGHPSGTLVGALLHHLSTTGGSLSSVGGAERPGIVHRLDKDTSGLLVVAKSDPVHRTLAEEFSRHAVHRVYRAIVRGEPPARGRIELGIGRDLWERKKFSARTARPKAAVTEFFVEERLGPAALLRVVPRTGRTHQIRVHLAYRRLPILGDRVYGGRHADRIDDVAVPRQMLHAAELGFDHPVEEKPLRFSAPLPDDMESVLEALRALRHPIRRNGA